ncbi:helix-turn-helix domain-containing protein [Burkholderia multivorans]|uniref:helix-turn-helix domain-containing protein n=2 Tax=Burkholderia TaxID=32008 RepID=UPI00207D5C6F|nr:helix-turn-helix transcriptional regulator [Burkholderia multivorans]MCO1459959.1 helix-turn-helix domain-containing protein [Burkholderia multivorans]
MEKIISGSVGRPPTAAELIRLRTRHGRTQAAVAARLDVTPRQVQRWEAGVGTMPIPSWQLLCLEWGTRFAEDFTPAPGITRGWDLHRDQRRETIERGDLVELQPHGAAFYLRAIVAGTASDAIDAGAVRRRLLGDRHRVCGSRGYRRRAGRIPPRRAREVRARQRLPRRAARAARLSRTHLPGATMKPVDTFLFIVTVVALAITLAVGVVWAGERVADWFVGREGEASESQRNTWIGVTAWVLAIVVVLGFNLL